MILVWNDREVSGTVGPNAKKFAALFRVLGENDVKRIE